MSVDIVLTVVTPSEVWEQIVIFFVPLNFMHAGLPRQVMLAGGNGTGNGSRYRASVPPVLDRQTFNSWTTGQRRTDFTTVENL